MNENAQRCVQASIAYAEQGRGQESLLLLERALLACPEDADLLLRYVERAETVATSEGEAHPEQLEALEAFVRSRVLHVAFEQVDAVLHRADGLRARRERLATTAEPADATDQDGGSAAAVLAAAKAGTLADEPLAPGADLGRHVRVLERARDLADGNDAAHAAIVSALERAHLAQSFDVVGLEVRNAMARIARWDNSGRAAYALQHVEGALRPVAALSDKLDPVRVAALDGLLGELRIAATTVATASHEAEAGERWAAFQRTHADDADAVLGFKAPTTVPADGACQRVLERARSLHEQLLDLLPALRGSKALEPARAYAGRIAAAGTKAAQTQQRRYDVWALSLIRNGYKAAKAHIGTVTDDEKKLGDALVDAFGEIDVRFLGAEVQRCYSEVFDLLYQHLDAPKSADDFDAPGKKLNVLSRMLARAKVTPSDF